MSNVKFLRGSQNNLDTLKSYQEGAFYLTTDTDRLYFAQSNNELAHLNQYVINVEKLEDLTGKTSTIPKNEGDFYYVEKENILCTYRNNEWIQINQQPEEVNDIAYVDAVTFAAEVVSNDEEDGIKITYTISQNVKDKDGADKTNNHVQDITSYFVIPSSAIGQVQVSSNVDIVAEKKNNNVALIKTDGVGSSADSNAGFAIKGAGGVSVDVDQYGDVEIKSETYGLKSAQSSKSIGLADSTGTVFNEVEIAASTANDNIIIDGTTENKIIVGHKDGFLDSFTSLENDGISRTNPTINIITGFTLDNGHISNIETAEVNLVADKIESIAIDNKNKLAITVGDSEGDNEYTIASGFDAGYTAGDGFVALGGNLNSCYYKKAEIDAKFKDLNALTFKGGVEPENGEISLSLPLPTQNVKSGDVYIVTGEGLYKGINAKIGDLFIASGEEAADSGFISGDQITWTYIPSGDETIYTYSLSVDNEQNSIVLIDNSNTKNHVIFDGDDEISITMNGNDGSNNVTITHAEHKAEVVSSTTNTDLNAETAFTVVTGVTVNDYGHVTQYDTTTFQMPGNNTLAFNTTKEENDDSKKTNIVLKNDEGTDISTVEINGGNLLSTEVNNDGTVLTINHDTVECTTNEEETTIYLSDSEDVILNIVDTITQDSYGHITGINTSKVKLIPVNQFNKDITYDAENKTLNINEEVKDQEGNPVATHAMEIYSDSIAMSLEQNQETKIVTVTADIVWGTF